MRSRAKCQCNAGAEGSFDANCTLCAPGAARDGFVSGPAHCCMCPPDTIGCRCQIVTPTSRQQGFLSFLFVDFVLSKFSQWIEIYNWWSAESNQSRAQIQSLQIQHKYPITHMEQLLHRTADESTYYAQPPGISLLCTTTNSYCSGQLFSSSTSPTSPSSTISRSFAEYNALYVLYEKTDSDPWEAVVSAAECSAKELRRCSRTRSCGKSQLQVRREAYIYMYIYIFVYIHV